MYAIEVSQEWQSKLIPKIGTAEIYAGLLDLYKADECLSNRELTKFTLDLKAQSVSKRKTSFELFSDRMWYLYPTYQLDRRCRPRPSYETQVHNFYELRKEWTKPALNVSEQLLDCPDSSLFLDKKEILMHQVALQSVPCSGEDVLCALIERLTGIFVGSTQNLNITLPKMMNGQAAEETNPRENLCWMTQTYWPCQSLLDSPLSCIWSSKCIILVRNPLEILPNLCD